MIKSKVRALIMDDCYNITHNERMVDLLARRIIWFGITMKVHEVIKFDDYIKEQLEND